MVKQVYTYRKADKTLGILTALYITCLLANITIGYRYISFWHIDVAGGIFLFTLSFIINDIIAERYDSSYAKMLILYGAICQIIFSSYIFLVLKLPYPTFWNRNGIYIQIMKPYLRFTLASTASIIIGSWLNIYFLSKWSRLVHGRYFALRSLGSSCIGELFVTISSMLIANFSEMPTSQLCYMIICCFGLKTIISIVAVWPAAFVVCLLRNDEISYDEKTKYIAYMVKMKQALQRFSKPAYRLEGLSAENYSASVYCRGARVVINQSITEIIFNSNIIQNMHPMEASHLGYYYGLLNNNENQDSNSLLNKNKIKPIFSLFFNKNRYLILSLSRRGLINYKMNNSSELYTKSPLEIYEDELVISEFEPSHACYIGILAGISKGKSQTSRPTNVVKLNLVYSQTKHKEDTCEIDEN